MAVTLVHEVLERVGERLAVLIFHKVCDVAGLCYPLRDFLAELVKVFGDGEVAHVYGDVTTFVQNTSGVVRRCL